jgi:hypothetical protein
VCWIHTCDNHGERPAGSKFKCAVDTAKVRYASLVFGSPAVVPVGSTTAGQRRVQLDPDGQLAPYGWGPGSRLWERSARHRRYWRGRIVRVLEQASYDPHSPWFDRLLHGPMLQLELGRGGLMALADLVGLVAWYLGLQLEEPFPSLQMARERVPARDPSEFDRSPDENFERTGADALVLAWLFDLLRITPAEVVYLLRYYADTDKRAETSPDWGLGELYEQVLTNPFLT